MSRSFQQLRVRSVFGPENLGVRPIEKLQREIAISDAGPADFFVEPGGREFLRAVFGTRSRREPFSPSRNWTPSAGLEKV